MSRSQSQSSFRLHSGDLDFNNRVDALFSSLQTAAKDLEPQMKRKHEDLEEEEEEEEKDDVGRERQPFRPPQRRPPQWRGGRGGGGRGRGGFGPRNHTPDYIKNPHNWTRYNMRDTPVLSDSENRREGLRLLADLESRTDRVETATDHHEMDCEEGQHSQHKIIFKKPSTTTSTTPAVRESCKPTTDKDNEQTEDSLNVDFGGSKKFVMQEYVVGQKKPKSKGKSCDESKIDIEKESVKKQVKLSYLMYEEED